VATAQERLGLDAFDAARHAGVALPLDQAIAEALALTEEIARVALPGAAADDPNRLTPREAEIVPFLVAGRTNREIAAALSVSPRTVGNHVASILAKWGIDSRRGVRAQALRLGLAADDAPLHTSPGS
jgi:DNA-binding NarL/FixJ family response regulator